MARRKNQRQVNDQKTTKHVRSYTMPKPPARVRPTESVKPKPVQPDTKPADRPDVKPESPKPKSPKPKN